MPPKQFTYAKEVPNSKVSGSSGIFRNEKALNSLITRPKGNHATLQETFLHAAKEYSLCNCLGTQNPDKSGYTWRTYGQVKDDATQLGSGIINMKLAVEKVDELSQRTIRMVGIYSKNRAEWMTLDISNALYKAVIIPLYDTLGPETISYVIGHSEIETLFCEASAIPNLWKSGNLHNLKTLVQFEDTIDPKNMEEAQKKNIQIITYKSVMQSGKEQSQPFAQVDPKDCFTFSYTSGTTGDPKGAMISHENLVSIIAAGQLSLEILQNDVHLSYLPLPHIFERLVVTTLLYCGSAIGFFGGDVLKLKDDLALLKPTIFVSVPRLYNKFYAAIKKGLDEATGCKKCLVDKAYNAKKDGLKNNNAYTNGMWDGIVFKKTKAVLGGRVTRMITGSAPISGEVLDFLRIVMCCPLMEGYGQTESTGASFCQDKEDTSVGHVGGPQVCLEYKVEDVPDMGYMSDYIDPETGKNTPRGEVCIRGGSVFLGYYKNKEKTDEAIDKDGWLHTGDVGVILPNGALKIVDRKKNIFKLAQGEYISPEKVENIYMRARGVAEVFVHGDSLQSYAVTVIVPDPAVIVQIAQENNISETSVVQLCKNEVIQQVFLKNCVNLGKKEGLKGFEQAKRIHLEPVSMAEQGCMTNTMKLQRHNARNVFKPQLDALYALGEPQAQAKA